VRETAFRPSTSEPDQGIQGLYQQLARDEARNAAILNDVVHALKEGRSPLLLTERKDHLDYFAERLARVARHLVILRGGMGAKADRAVRAQLDAIPPNEERILLATGRYVGEGFDDARLDTLFLALPVSWKGTLVQYTGRLHRLHTGKREVRIFDYVDREVPVLLRMFEKRLRGYRAIGYGRGEAPLGYAEPADDPDRRLRRRPADARSRVGIEPRRRVPRVGTAVKAIERRGRAGHKARGSISGARLAEMIEEATVDAYGPNEQATGWFTVIGDNLDVPFETEVLGVKVTVKRLELRDDSIVAVCAPGADRQVIGLVDLPMPSPRPEGWEWLEAYRRWRGGR